MTREEELARLIAEQKADDTHIARREKQDNRFIQHVSLDQRTNESGLGSGIGWDEMFVGVEYDFDAMVESGDYEAQGTLVSYMGASKLNRGYAMKPTPHGTYNGYNNYGCRCAKCVDAFRAYMRIQMRRYKKRKRAEEMAKRPAIACACCGTKFVPWRTTKKYCSSRCTERACARRKRGAAVSDAAFVDRRFAVNRAA